jgi:hypothetical protein
MLNAFLSLAIPLFAFGCSHSSTTQADAPVASTVDDFDRTPASAAEYLNDRVMGKISNALVIGNSDKAVVDHYLKKYQKHVQTIQGYLAQPKWSNKAKGYAITNYMAKSKMDADLIANAGVIPSGLVKYLNTALTETENNAYAAVSFGEKGKNDRAKDSLQKIQDDSETALNRINGLSYIY